MTETPQVPAQGDGVQDPEVPGEEQLPGEGQVPGEEPAEPAGPDVTVDPTVPPEHRPIVPAGLREPVDLSFEAPGQPEREMRDRGKRRRPRRAVRPGTNPDADDSPDVASGRQPAPEREDPRARWMREQRPPHWE